MSTPPYAAYAAIIKTIIFADNFVTHKEREMFDRFFEERFSFDSETSAKLWVEADQTLADITDDLKAVREDLTDQPMAMLQFMKFLNRCIISDGFNDGEYETFEQVEKALLPQL
jgi:uncharacterized tellurite resistance protein B-like protein